MSEQKDSGGIGFGEVIAALVSWSINKSIIWALIHGWFGWFYIIYAIFSNQLK